MIKNMIIAKVFGWVLLVAGIAVIGYALWSSYTIFTAQKPAPEIFSLSGSETGQNAAGGDVNQMVQQAIGQQLQSLIPSGSIVQLLNMISWSAFAGILIFGGSKISLLGIRLIRKG